MKFLKVCDTCEFKDYIFGAALKVKTWTLANAYTHQTESVSAHGQQTAHCSENADVGHGPRA